MPGFSDVTKVVFTYVHPLRFIDEVKLYDSNGAEISNAWKDEGYSYDVNPNASGFTDVLGRYNQGLVTVHYRQSGVGESAILYAETDELFVADFLSGSAGLGLRRPHPWMLAQNYLYHFGNVAAFDTGSHKDLSLKGWFASRQAAQTSIDTLDPQYNFHTRSFGDGSIAPWRLLTNDDITPIPAGHSEYIAHAQAHLRNGVATQSDWYVAPASSAFSITYTAEESPTAITQGHFPYADGDKWFRLNMGDHLSGWIPIDGAADATEREWFRVGYRSNIAGGQSLFNESPGIWNLEDFQECQFRYSNGSAGSDQMVVTPPFPVDQIRVLTRQHVANSFHNGRSMRFTSTFGVTARLCRDNYHRQVGAGGDDQIYYLNFLPTAAPRTYVYTEFSAVRCIGVGNGGGVGGSGLLECYLR